MVIRSEAKIKGENKIGYNNKWDNTRYCNDLEYCPLFCPCYWYDSYLGCCHGLALCSKRCGPCYSGLSDETTLRAVIQEEPNRKKVSEDAEGLVMRASLHHRLVFWWFWLIAFIVFPLGALFAIVSCCGHCFVGTCYCGNDGEEAVEIDDGEDTVALLKKAKEKSAFA